ncbi:MAG: mammalian cell entry protein, partial [Actinomycetota bacterium]|nr:mammalian cell entry protein [Actinomycetota bacterium]
IPAQPHAPEWQPPSPVAPAAYSGNVGFAAYGGNVGPVGSQTERNQLGLITGQHEPASVATQLLLGPVARGTTVSFVPAGTGDHK